MKDHLWRITLEAIFHQHSENTPLKHWRIIRQPFPAAQKIAPRRRAGRRLRMKNEGATPLRCIPVSLGFFFSFLVFDQIAWLAL
jgi:hypothetical protein